MKPHLHYILILLYSVFSSLSYAQSASDIDSLKRSLHSSPITNEKIDILNKLGQFYAKKNSGKSISYIHDAMELSKMEDYHIGLIDAYSNKGDVLLYTGKNKNAKVAYEEALVFAKVANDRKREAYLLIDMGVVWRKIGDYNKAYQFYKEAEKIGATLDDTGILSRVYNNTGYLLKLESKYGEALKYLLKSLEIVEKTGDLKAQAGIYSNIGEVYDLHIADFETASIYHQKALKIRLEIQDLPGVCISFRNLGGLERRKKNYTEAIEYLETGLNLADSIQYKTLIASIHFQIAYVYREINRPKVAIPYAQTALNMHQAANNHMGYLWAVLLYGELKLDLKNYEAALRYGEEAYQLSLETNRTEALGKSAKLISDIYFVEKNFEKAYEYHVIFKNKNDKLITKINLAKEATQNLKMQYEQETERLLEAQKQEKLLFQYKQQQTFFAYTAAFLIFILFSLYVNNRTKKQANKELLLKNKELIEARKTAETAAMAKQNFLATMSHEIRTPMNAVIGFTNLLLEEESQQQSSHLRYLKFSAKQLLSLMNDLLDYSKMEAQQLRIEQIDFDCLFILEEVAQVYQRTNQSLNIQTEIKESTFTRYLNGDSVRLNQILINLVDNAVKFTPSGKIWIRAWTDIEEEKVLLHIEVEDTGIGIAKEDQFTIFDSFTQVSSASTRNHGGTGLGLSICKKLVELQGGEITLESQLGRGSKFSFHLPYAFAKGTFDHNINTSLPSNEKDTSFFIGIKALIVEDNLLNQKIFQAILEKWGMNISIVFNGKEAVQIVQKQEFDLILMDLFMPNMSGFEASKRIRALPLSCSDIPIIAVTASILEEIEEQANAVGINHIIGKPFQKEELQSVIQQTLSGAVNKQEEIKY